jgi:hypothetical protein
MVKILIVPLPHARTSLQAQVHDKLGWVDPLLGPDSTHPYIYMCEITKNNSLSLPLRLRRLALIVFQQAAQPLPTSHLFLLSRDCLSW